MTTLNSLICRLILGVSLCALLPPTQATINDTGVATCSNATQNGLICPVSGFPGQDAEYGTNIFDFTKIDASGNDLLVSATTWSCVQDNVTGLMWEVKTADGGLQDKNWTYTHYDSAVPGGTSSGGTCKTPGRCDTEKFVQDVNATGLCGFNDWRMPNLQELSNIVDYRISVPDPTISTTYFLDALGVYFWTASSYTHDPSSAWGVNFSYGNAYGSYRSGGYAVRLVRGVQAVSNFSDNGDGTITDNSTKLMWAKCAVGQSDNNCASGSSISMNWAAALTAAQNSAVGGYSDWRLPNAKELQSIVDYSSYTPAINSTFFPNAPGNKFWSTSSNAYFPSSSWYIDFDHGHVDYYSRTYNSAVRFVRAGPQLPSSYNLTVNKIGTGTGTVTSTVNSAPGGIDCGSDCSENHISTGTVVTLTATPDTGNSFRGWSGNLDCSDGIITMDADKICTATFNLPTVTATVGIGGSVDPATAQPATIGATTTFTVTADTGYTTSKIVSGDCPQGGWNNKIWTTGEISYSCTVSFSFTPNTYTVTPTAGTGGSVSPNTAQTASHDATKTFTVTAGTNYTINTVVDGNCTQGSWNGNVWTTGPIVANCTVNFGFTAASSTTLTSGVTLNNQSVTKDAWKYYSITVPQWTSDLTFTTTTNSATSDIDIYMQFNDKPTLSNYICRPYSSGGNETCTASNPAVGTWFLGVYGNTSANYSITGTIYPVEYTVTPSAGTGGTYTPTGNQTVNNSATQAFTVTATTGYTTDNTVGGDCPQGSWNGNIWTTGPITADCTVSFSFAAATAFCWACLPSSGGWRSAVYATVAAKSMLSRDATTSVMYEITPWATSGGHISPDLPVLAPAGTESQFTVTAKSGYTAAVSGSCGGSLIDDVFTTKPLARDCNVAASFSLDQATPPPGPLPLTGEGVNDTPLPGHLPLTGDRVHDIPPYKFSFTKLDKFGYELPDIAINYACVRDNVTGLIWEAKAADGGLHDQQWTYSWDNAQDQPTETTCATPGNCTSGQFVQDVNAAGLCGSDDWRVPTVAELTGLVNYTSPAPGPAINADYFPATGNLSFWAVFNSTVDGTSPRIVDFHAGNINYLTAPTGQALRLVRQPHPVASTWTDNGNGTVTNATSKLMWATCPIGQYGTDCTLDQGDATILTWQQAHQAANIANIAGYTDWRLPTVQELQAILEQMTTYFPTSSEDKFWTATPSANGDATAWTVDFPAGLTNKAPISDYHRVRLVRDVP